MQRDRLYQLVQRAADPAFALTARGEVWVWNTAAEHLTGVAAAEALHQPFASLVDARGPLGKPMDAEYCERAIRDGAVPSFDVQLRTVRGHHIWVNLSVLVFEPVRTGPALVVHLAHDITERRRRSALFGRLLEASREIVRLVDEEHHLLPVSPLTEQEERILHLFAAGHTPGQVTRSLGISTQTLRNHLHHVNQKLGTHNRLEAVIHAVRRRLI